MLSVVVGRSSLHPLSSVFVGVLLAFLPSLGLPLLRCGGAAFSLSLKDGAVFPS